MTEFIILNEYWQPLAPETDNVLCLLVRRNGDDRKFIVALPASPEFWDNIESDTANEVKQKAIIEAWEELTGEKTEG